MKKFLKNQKGVTGADAILAVAIAVLFTGIIVTLAYNIYITTNSLKRSSQALSYITSTFEYVATQDYDDITTENIKNYIDGNEEKIIDALDEGKVSTKDDTPYKAVLSVTKYNETEDNEEKLDLVKEITMSITYKLGDKEQKIEMKTAKLREKFENPNRPDLDLINEEENKYPIKYVEGQWKIATINDADWYNYDDGIWATVLVTEEQKVVGDIVTKDDGTVYLWIPRFEYNPNPENETGYKVNFLYKNTEKIITKKVNGETSLISRDFSEGNTTVQTIPSEFSNVTGVWIKNLNLNQDPYLYFNNTECKYHLNSKIYEGKLW